MVVEQNGDRTNRSPRGRSITRSILLALASIALTLLAVELGFVLFWSEPSIEYDGFETYPTNPRGYLDRLPAGGFGIVTDRSRHACEAPATEDDIVFVGDSFTWGQGVRVEDTLSSRIRAMGYRVRNCATPGQDLNEILSHIATAATQVPKLIVYGLVLNDTCGRLEDRTPHLTTPDDSTKDSTIIVDDGIWTRGRARELHLERRLNDLGAFDFLRASTAFRWFHRRLLIREIAEHTERVYRECWTPSDALTHSFDAIARHGSMAPKFLVVVWPLFVDLDDYPFAAAHETIRTHLQQRQVPTVDLLSVFEGRDAADLIVHPGDRHPNEHANELATAPVSKAIVQLIGPP